MNRELLRQALDGLIAAEVLLPLRYKSKWVGIKAIAALEAELVNYEEPLPPIDIGVDVTPEGTHVTAFYRRPDAVQEMFYSQFHPLTRPEIPAKIFGPNLEQILNAAGFYRREWVGLTNEELIDIREIHEAHIFQIMFAVEAKIREKNGANS